MDFFVALDAWQSALVFAGLMLAGWFLGTKMRSADSGVSSSTRIEDGSLALFALLLAFCFSGAASRYDTRKDLLSRDAVAIGELASVGSMLQNPDRQDLRNEIRRYVAQRIEFGPMRLDDPKMPQVIKEGRDSQERMLAIIRRAVANNDTPSVHAPLLNAFNAVTEAHDRRLFAVRDHVNGSIVMMLVFFGVFTTFTMGRLQDRTGRGSLLKISSYIGLVALVFFVIMDLEQPRRGLILVSQVPMQELSQSLQGP